MGEGNKRGEGNSSDNAKHIFRLYGQIMKNEIKEIESTELFTKELKAVQKKVGKEMLTDNDLFMLTCEKLLRTYTFEEKGYK